MVDGIGVHLLLLRALLFKGGAFCGSRGGDGSDTVFAPENCFAKISWMSAIGKFMFLLFRLWFEPVDAGSRSAFDGKSMMTMVSANGTVSRVVPLLSVVADGGLLSARASLTIGT